MRLIISIYVLLAFTLQLFSANKVTLNECYESAIKNYPIVKQIEYQKNISELKIENLNSKYVVPVNAGKYIDDVGSSEFEKFDAIILNNYDYHNNYFNLSF